VGWARESVGARRKGLRPSRRCLKPLQERKVRSWAKGLRTLAASKTSYLGSA